MRDRPEFDSTQPGDELTEAEQAEVDARLELWRAVQDADIPDLPRRREKRG